LGFEPLEERLPLLRQRGEPRAGGFDGGAPGRLDERGRGAQGLHQTLQFGFVGLEVVVVVEHGETRFQHVLVERGIEVLEPPEGLLEALVVRVAELLHLQVKEGDRGQ
jgi:hypothetical protein